MIIDKKARAKYNKIAKNYSKPVATKIGAREWIVNCVKCGTGCSTTWNPSPTEVKEMAFCPSCWDQVAK